MENLAEIGRLLRRGGIVVYPTETSYAIGCIATNPQAVERLRNLKGREASKTLPVVVANIEDLCQIDAEVLPLHKSLANQFWPGPLTMLFRTNAPMPEGVVSNEGFIAARISSHPIARRLAELAGAPVVSTSCNPAGLPPALTIRQAKQYFEHFAQIAAFIDGGLLEGGASTIIQITPQGSIRILRHGAIPASELAKFAPIEP